MVNQPLLLHHYTSGIGLLGIFDTDSMWATSIHSLNDAKEFVHAIEVARSNLYSLRRVTSDPKDVAINEAFAESLERIEQLSIYVTCFSEMEDSLSQWRGYCPPGFGYSLGFFGEELRKISQPQGFQLVKCIYEDSEQRSVIESWASRALTELRKTLPPSADPRQHVSDTCHLFFSEFAAFAPVLKNRAFRDEYEWRLVGLVPSNDPRIRLRAGRSMLVPYVPIQLGLPTNESLVWNIRVGPSPNMQLANNAATHFFKRAKIRNGIGPSMVPYRDW